MSDNLVKARSTILFIVALLTASMLALWIERTSERLDSDAAERRRVRQEARLPSSEAFANGTLGAGASLSGKGQADEHAAQQDGQRLQQTTAIPAKPAATEPPVPSVSFSKNVPERPDLRPLTEREREWASVAWTYFVNNTDAKTGLANSVDQFPAATLWDTSSYLLGMIAAQRLKLISEKEFDARMKKALNSLARLPLIEDALPNKSYDMRSLAMIDYAGKPVPDGIGWSAIDIGRMVVPLHILVWHYPRHAGAAKKVISRWDLDRVVQSSMLFGASVASNGKLEQLQEGRLGYEQYAAKGFALLGLDVSDALNYRHQLAYVDIYGISVPYDKRDPTKFGARNFVLSEPYMLEGLEYGLDGIGKEFAWRVYQAQEARFKSANILTAVSEDHLDKAPYFAYNTVFSDGKPWNMITEAGEDASAFRSMSVKTAFAWHALYRTDYTERLIETAASLHDRKKGWYAGLYEEGGQPNRALTANTNGVILESLAFIAHGPLMNAHRDAK